jgi:hypothetical protein
LGKISGFMQSLKNRLPSVQEIIPVYAVTASLLSGWMFVLFVWNLPSWLNFMPLGGVFSVLSYALVTSLLQSLLFTGILLLLSFVLPASIFRREFTVRGALAAFVLLGLVFGRAFLLKSAAPWYFTSLPMLAWVSFLLLVLLSWGAARSARLRQMIVSLADRFIVFLYLLVPLFMISVAMILLRNLV